MKISSVKPSMVRSSANQNINTRTSANTRVSVNQSQKYPPLSVKSKEDEYIASLQKKVYYLELEMKLMKEREL